MFLPSGAATALTTSATDYLSAEGTATIDGVKSPGEWDAAAKIDFAVNQSPGSPGPPMPASLLVMNDGNDIYIAYLISRSTLGSSSVSVDFDNDDDGMRANGDDVLLVNPAIGFFDEYYTNQPPCQGICLGIEDFRDGGTTDGRGATTNNGSFSFYEMAHPLNSNDDKHDFSLGSGDVVGASGEVRFCDTGGCADTTVPGPFRIAIAPLPDGKANQTITFRALPTKTYGDADFSVAATARSRLAVSFAASGNCTVAGTIVHLVGAGACTITASQAGDSKWHPAPDVSQTFSIAKAGQTITFDALANKRYGAADFVVHASASSGLPVSFAARGSCTMSDSRVHLTGVGSCAVTASQRGDVNYLAATDVSRTFAIRRPPCKVPKVIGKRLATAKRAIARNHCRTGKVRYAYSPRRKGLVISQSRRAGRVLPPSSKINLLISRGRKP
jgi:hypothetical protein